MHLSPPPKSLLISTVVLAVIAGAVVGGYMVFWDGSGADDGKTDDDRKQDGQNESLLSHTPDDDDGTGKEKTPVWPYVAAGIAFVSAMAFTSLSGMVYIKTRRGENIVRNDLLDLITVNPGMNLTTIRKELQLSQGAISYHIWKLEKGGQIISDKGAKERRYYPSSMGYQNAMEKAREDELGSMVSNPTSRRILTILNDGPATQNELVKELGVSPSTVHWHMDRMIKVDMVRKEQRGRSVQYELVPVRERNN